MDIKQISHKLQTDYLPPKLLNAMLRKCSLLLYLVVLSVASITISCSEAHKDYRITVKEKNLKGYLEYIKKYPNSKYIPKVVDILLDLESLSGITSHSDNPSICFDNHKTILDSLNLFGQTRFVIDNLFAEENVEIYCATKIIEGLANDKDLSKVEKNIVLSIASIGYLEYSNHFIRIGDEILVPKIESEISAGVDLFVKEQQESLIKIENYIIAIHEKAKALLKTAGMYSTLMKWDQSGSVSLDDFDFSELIQ